VILRRLYLPGMAEADSFSTAYASAICFYAMVYARGVNTAISVIHHYFTNHSYFIQDFMTIWKQN
jgi:hypothetical protein